MRPTWPWSRKQIAEKRHFENTIHDGIAEWIEGSEEQEHPAAQRDAFICARSESSSRLPGLSRWRNVVGEYGFRRLRENRQRIRGHNSIYPARKHGKG